ncbi:hypothetical protein ES703_64083 [subsurface metagenome]
MIDAESAIFWFFVAGTLGVATKVAWEVSNRIGKEITAEDLLPMPPPHLPLPRFLYKPELMAELKRR